MSQDLSKYRIKMLEVVLLSFSRLSCCYTRIDLAKSAYTATVDVDGCVIIFLFRNRLDTITTLQPGAGFYC